MADSENINGKRADAADVFFLDSPYGAAAAAATWGFLGPAGDSLWGGCLAPIPRSAESECDRLLHLNHRSPLEAEPVGWADEFVEFQHLDKGKRIFGAGRFICFICFHFDRLLGLVDRLSCVANPGGSRLRN